MGLSPIQVTEPCGFDTRLIDLKRDVNHPLVSPWLSFISTFLERVLGFEGINEIYRGVKKEYPKDERFFSACVRSLKLNIEMLADSTEMIPREGALLLVANHPFGALDAIALGHHLAQVRPDVKIMANSLLARMPEAVAEVIPVDPFGGRGSVRQNIRSMRSARTWLEQGGTLVIFPAGEVSHYHPRKNRVTDPVWNTHAANLAKKVQCPVLPVYFEGRNSWFFQMAGLLHPRLRTLLLAREVVAGRNKRIRMVIGRALFPRVWAHLSEPVALTRTFRSATYALASTIRKKAKMPSVGADLSPTPVNTSAGSHLVELNHATKGRVLARRGDMEVRIFHAHEAPGILEELGRLRELTFRAVGEGTGKALDLDSFDTYYQHLVLWNRGSGDIIGAYRLGLADEILKSHGAQGLYTASLFKLKPAFFRQFGPAIELGRSFVVEEHQKSYGALSLLWRGIGQFVVDNPHYTHLFGPVSISGDYEALSQNLMIQYCRRKAYDRRGARWVRPTNPPRSRYARLPEFRELSSALETIEDVSGLISYLEHDNKGVPVLLRHYLKLNAKLLSFNIDPAFNDVLDGLMVADLRETPRSILSRFMGKEGLDNFLGKSQYPTGQKSSLAFSRLFKAPSRKN